jgi:hypothetical protein
MARLSFFKRFLLPLLVIVGLRIASSLVYHASSGLPPGLLRDLLINTSGPITFATLWFFALVGPPIAYFRGAAFGERLVIAFANPVMWVAVVLAQVACQYHGIELVYFFLLPWTFGIMCVTCLELALAELACRTLHKRKWPQDVRILHPGVLALLAGGLTGTYFGLIKGQEWVYMVVHHYAEHVL